MERFTSGLAAAVLPQADFSISDIFEEVRELREENAALKAHVTLLSQLGVEGGGNKLAEHAAATTAALLGTTTSKAPPESDHMSCIIQCLGAELASLEAQVERTRLHASIEREELAMRCDELGRALEQRVLLAERTQQQAVAEARQASADAVADLEDQLASLTEEMASREALVDAYGADAELERANLQVLEAQALGEREAQSAGRLRDELDRIRVSHADDLRLVEQRVEDGRAEAARAAQAAKASESVIESLQSQLVRLSEGFNKQVEEVLRLEKRLERSKAGSVDKATARSWVVNFVENGSGAHGVELLQIMAEWWEFSPEDCARVGLVDEPHPSREAALFPPSDVTLAESFASFLDAESEEASPSRRAARLPS